LTVFWLVALVGFRFFLSRAPALPHNFTATASLFVLDRDMVTYGKEAPCISGCPLAHCIPGPCAWVAGAARASILYCHCSSLLIQLMNLDMDCIRMLVGPMW
jgi:hypothetical protein